jgi:hypothetical protein
VKKIGSAIDINAPAPCCLSFSKAASISILGLLQIEWVIFVILRAIPVFDGDAIADWDW